MRAEGLRAQRGYGRRPGKHGGKPAAVAPNHLQREFNVSQSNRVWVTDITYIRTHEGWLYLAAVDLFSRKIDAENGVEYRHKNCELAPHLFQAQPGVTAKFWCEQRRVAADLSLLCVSILLEGMLVRPLLKRLRARGRKLQLLTL